MNKNNEPALEVALDQRECSAGSFCVDGEMAACGTSPHAGSFATSDALPPLKTHTSLQATFCPQGSSSVTPCERGHRCPDPSLQLSCDLTMFCPEGIHNETLCLQGHYCATPSSQAPCVEGTFCPTGSVLPSIVGTGNYTVNDVGKPTVKVCFMKTVFFFCLVLVYKQFPNTDGCSTKDVPKGVLLHCG